MNVSDVESDFIATGLHGIMVSGGGGIVQCSLDQDGAYVKFSIVERVDLTSAFLISP